jgi:iron complex transport system ATP-binding protein
MASASAHAGLSVHVASQSVAGHDILQTISLHVPDGHWLAVVGANGAGKSTLLRTLAGLLPLPERRGHVVWRGTSVHALSPIQRARQVAWLAADEPALSGWVARDLVMLGRWPHQGLTGARTQADEQAVDRAMAVTGCAAWGGRRVDSLSSGERQRVRLARMLATEAALLLMDEPVSHLDPPHQGDWLAWIQRLTQRPSQPSAVVVSVLHDLNLALAADSVAVMAHGSLLHHGAPDDLATRQAMVDAFDGRITMNHVQGRWRCWLSEHETSQTPLSVA